MTVFCKLRNRKIDVGECYDMQMVRNKCIIPDALSEPICIDDSNEICPHCKYNQLLFDQETSDMLRYLKYELPYPSKINLNGFAISFHDNFLFEYDWNGQTLINGKLFYEIGFADIENYVRQLVNGSFVIIQYKSRLFHKVPLKVVKAHRFKCKHQIPKSVEKIFTVNEVIHDSQAASK